MVSSYLRSRHLRQPILQHQLAIEVDAVCASVSPDQHVAEISDIVLEVRGIYAGLVMVPSVVI